MVQHDAADFLSSAARKCGWDKGGYLCYEEDCDAAIVYRELLDKKLLEKPPWIKDAKAFEETINRSLMEYNPKYWEARQRALPMSERLREGAALAADDPNRKGTRQRQRVPDPR